MKQFLCLLFLIITSAICFGQENAQIDYRSLQEYEGTYEYVNNTRLQLAASPRDNKLYAIINEVRYPLKTVAKDNFLDVQNTKVSFERNSANRIVGYRAANTFFKLLSKENFPVEIWFSRSVKGGGKFAYKYAKPAELKDGLNAGSIKNTDLDASLIKQMVEKIADETYKNIHSVLIVKDGKLVVEEYFYEYDRNRLHQLRSTTKSVVSALVGIAVEKGFR